MATEQEEFWRGDFGNRYTDRNQGEERLDSVVSSLAFFSKVLDRTRGVRSVLEIGANIGLNLMALQKLIRDPQLSAVEINEKAVSELRSNLPSADVYHTSVHDFQPTEKRDLVFTRGFLIHVNPGRIKDVYKVIYESTQKYILISEYYNPEPREISYRGNENKLFKRDFAGEMIHDFKDLSIVDYGFVYHLDPNFPQDDFNWFLMEKNGG